MTDWPREWPRWRLALAGAWVVAAVATAGSLYYQYGMPFYPCELCWFQRILMYPLVLVVGYATLAGDRGLARLVVAFGVLGAGVAAYHSWLQIRPSRACTFGGCGEVQFRLAGLLAIPNQSLLAFLAITAAAVAVVAWGHEDGPLGAR